MITPTRHKQLESLIRRLRQDDRIWLDAEGDRLRRIIERCKTRLYSDKPDRVNCYARVMYL
jgi:hypothetical protein